MMQELALNQVYDHYKDGKYLVLSVADESTNIRKGAKVVIYVSLAYGRVKSRDLEEFIEPVIWPDGSRRPRFVVATE